MMSNYENSTPQQNLIQIYEFSTGFDNPHFSEKYQRWVSGGYLQEVASESRPVPEEIQDSVKRGYFRINNNFPPDIDIKEIALIARDISNYSILAVATGESDEKLRPVVAYRYFWLQKTNSNLNIDGVGTLLHWWLRQNKPCFDFTDISANQEPFRKIDDLAQIYTVNDSMKIFEEQPQKFSNFLPEITVSPYISSGEIEERALHLVTLYLHQKYRVPLAWAWNVTWLEKSASNNLTLIHCVDEETYNSISRDVERDQKPIDYIPKVSGKPVYSRPINQEQPNIYGLSTTSKISDMNSDNVSEIKRIIQNIANSNDNDDKNDIHNLINFIKKVSIQDWKWDKIKKTERFNSQKINKNTVRHSALLVLLGYKLSVEWLEWLRQNRQSIIFNYLHKSLKLQEKIESIAKYHTEVHQQLIVCVFLGISQFLISYQQTNDKGQKQKIEWLLLKSNSIWSRSFISYGQNIFYQLQRQEPNQSNDEFYQELLDSFRQWEEKNPITTHKVPISRNLINLAELFQKSKNYDLSAFLYQLERGSVPTEVYKQVVQGIIPLKESIDQPNEKSRIISENLKKLPLWVKITGVTSGLLILIIFALLLYYLNSRTEQAGTEKCNISNDTKCLVSSNLERNIFFWERTKNSQVKEKIKEEITNLREKGDAINKSKAHRFIKELLLPEIKEIKLNSQKLNQNPIEQNSYSEDIGTVNTILQTLGRLPEEKPITTFAPQLIKKFQKDYNIPQTGTVNSKTWNAMQSELTKKQLQKTVEVLRIIFETQNDNQIEEKIRQLQDCKKDAFQYLTCVKNLQKQIQPTKATK